jgi:hypothetical protein
MRSPSALRRSQNRWSTPGIGCTVAGDPVAELADAPGLNPGGPPGRVGSSPTRVNSTEATPSDNPAGLR